MSEELGKNYPCFGEFKCPRCHKKWQSSKAWADYGQQCKSCAINAMPYELKKLFVYICNNCGAKWSWAYEYQGQKCKKCSSSELVRPLDREKYEDRQYIKAHKLRELHDDDDENHIDPNKEHREDLCEKCQKLGRPCRLTAGERYVTMPVKTSFVNTGTRSNFIPESLNKQRISSTYHPALGSYSSGTYSTSNAAKKYEEHIPPIPTNNANSDRWCIIL